MRPISREGGDWSPSALESPFDEGVALSLSF